MCMFKILCDFLFVLLVIVIFFFSIMIFGWFCNFLNDIVVMKGEVLLLFFDSVQNIVVGVVVVIVGIFVVFVVMVIEDICFLFFDKSFFCYE